MKIGQTTDAALAKAAGVHPNAHAAAPGAPSCWSSRSARAGTSDRAGTEARVVNDATGAPVAESLYIFVATALMTDSRYEARVQDLISDAEEHAARADWDAVRDLARAALSLAPSNEAGPAPPGGGGRRGSRAR